MKAIRIFVARRVGEFAGLGIRQTGLIASCVRKGGFITTGDNGIGKLIFLSFVQERNLYLISEAYAEGWTGADRSANSRWRGPERSRIPTPVLT